MSFLEGNRSGDDVLLLGADREIAEDNLWAVRVLIALLLVPAFMNGLLARGLGPTVTLLILALPVYWVAIRLASAANPSEN